MSTIRTSCVALALLLAVSSVSTAQDDVQPPSGMILDAVAKALKDPSTYAPASMLYVSSRLDWASSQTFFQHGDLEENPHFTRSGLPHDAPLSYGAGNWLLVRDAVSVASLSLANNALSQLAVRRLIEREPERRKLWVALGWIERTAVASVLTYQLSAAHFDQWKRNEQVAAQRGY